MISHNKPLYFGVPYVQTTRSGEETRIMTILIAVLAASVFFDHLCTLQFTHIPV
jgi:hypothetical protein